MSIGSKRINGVRLVEPRLFEDSRGYFYEGYNSRILEDLGCEETFVQENISGSRQGVLRGLHYQLDPCAQGKLVRVIRGEVFDVVVDLRSGSPAYGRWESMILSEGNRIRLWVPPGLAHGFLVVSEFAEVVYSVTRPYSPAHERALLWNDPDLAIPWPLPAGEPLLSEKDRRAAPFHEAETNFVFCERSHA
ncbi:MAG: dTDP-4-dehydrorhamnose 3,5-epimerase [Vicinamibacteria bacterium]|nr:dTDP-4-dehydrorhamnose 3,5-epimerase [Vicinamibacteria bacterium]